MRWKRRGADPGAPGRDCRRGGVFPSPGLAELLEAVARLSPSRFLDLGPAQESTIELLTHRHIEVQVAALEPDALGRGPLPEFEEASFTGILCWDYLVRLPPTARPRLAAAVSRWLAPGGGALLVLPIPARSGLQTFRFRARSERELEYIPQGPLDPGLVPTTRRILEMFEDLDCTGARILRHGAQEFVLRKTRVPV